MDGVLVIDKPQGLTSHDVVVVARRVLAERRIGHTGTLDPLATGVLALACGRATRLVSFLTASDKEYLAEIRFGVSTDSYDITGQETTRTGGVPSREALDAALDSLRGSYLQPPPPVSAKKIEGRRAYALARAGVPVQPAPVPVSVSRVELLNFEGAVATVRLQCSAGFYVRAFAHAAGEHAGVGACLQALRRLRSGEFDLSDAITLDALQAAPEAAAHMIAVDRLLPRLPAAVMTSEGLQRVSHGRDVGPEHVSGGWPEIAQVDGSPAQTWVRLTTAEGTLLGLAVPGNGPGLLHPSVVLS